MGVALIKVSAELADSRPIVGFDLMSPCCNVPMSADLGCPVCEGSEVFGVVSWIVFLEHQHAGDLTVDVVMGVPLDSITYDGRN